MKKKKKKRKKKKLMSEVQMNHTVINFMIATLYRIVWLRGVH